MKTSLILCALLAMGINACQSNQEAAQTPENQAQALQEAAPTQTQTFNAICPIGGEKVDPSAPTVEYKGKKIGFCCAGCIEEFQEDPEMALKNLSPDGQKWVSPFKGSM